MWKSFLLLVTAMAALDVAASSDEVDRAPCRAALTDVAPSSGIDFRHERGATAEKHLPETMGSGLAWLDFDGDGWTDLYVVQSGPFPPAEERRDRRAANRLFRNRGRGADGRVTFEDVPGAGAGDTGYGQGVVAADVDGDGWTDLYVANFGPDVLLLNRGAGGRVAFEDRTAAAGLGLGGWSSSAAFGDADLDGDLDLYVTRYLEYDVGHDLFCGDVTAGLRSYCGPELFAGAGDRFYLNKGDGTFEDASGSAGLGPADGKGLGVVFTDLDGDRRPDVYVANDQTLNFLFVNRAGAGGRITFEEQALFSGLAVNREGKPEAGMGIALGDVDGDGDPEIMVTNFDVETNTLYRNLGGFEFLDVSVESGFALPSFNLLGFGLVAADLDLDGALDVYVTNGHVREVPRRDTVTYAQPDLVLLGDGAGSFSEGRCPRPGGPHVGRGLAWADYDADGDPDLAINNSGGPLELLRNDAAARGWLGVRLRGRAPNTAAVGAEAAVTTLRGRQTRRVLAGDSYQSSSTPDLLFGLGEDREPSKLEVAWPSGRRLVILAPPPDRYLNLREPGS